ncbi:MAG: hypothetical protein H0X31_00905 [Nostocaceae cyanobacterium]|nr:hypothetical protein [Nostocaceae cyanobacterium]
MAVLSDLTFQQINDASSGVNPFIVVGAAPNAKLMLDVSLATGMSANDLKNSGVVGLAIKLGELMAAAQVAANANQPSGERLAAFPALIYGQQQADGTVQIQRNIIAKMKVTPQNAPLFGVNA